MKRTFLRSHILAWITGFTFACIGSGVLIAIPPKMLLHFPFVGLALLVFAMVTLLEFLMAWRVAVLLGPYDLLLAIAGAQTVAMAFSFSYTMDVHTFLPDNEHTFFDVLTWGARPFDFWGQFQIFGLIAGWAIVTVGAALALKRARERKNTAEEYTPPQILGMTGCLAIDLVLLACLAFGLIRSEVVDRMAEGKAPYLLGVLASHTAPIEQRIEAIDKLSDLDSDAGVALLRRAMQEEQPPINLLAAGALLRRNDISGLPLLERSLMLPPQTLRMESTHSGSFGIVTSVSGSERTMNFGYDLPCISDPGAAPVLVRLMTSSNLETRRGAAKALNNIASTQTIDTLISGLDDEDIEVRFNCATALAKITHEEHYPFRDLYGQNEQVYLDHWKVWAKDRSQKP